MLDVLFDPATVDGRLAGAGMCAGMAAKSFSRIALCAWRKVEHHLTNRKKGWSHIPPSAYPPSATRKARIVRGNRKPEEKQELLLVHCAACGMTEQDLWCLLSFFRTYSEAKTELAL